MIYQISDPLVFGAHVNLITHRFIYQNASLKKHIKYMDVFVVHNVVLPI